MFIGEIDKKYKWAIHPKIHKHRKIFSTFLAFRKSQSETMMRYYFPIKMTKIEDKVLARMQGDGCRGPSCLCQGVNRGAAYSGKVFPWAQQLLCPRSAIVGKEKKIELTLKWITWVWLNSCFIVEYSAAISNDAVDCSKDEVVFHTQ